MASTSEDVRASTAGEEEEEEVRYLAPFPLTGPLIHAGGRSYRGATLDDCLRFRTFADEMDGFELHYESASEHTLVWSKKVKGEPMHLIKVFGVFASTPQHPDEGCSPRELYDLLQDAVFRSEWDVYRQEAFRITLLQHNTDIGYYAAKSPAPMVANRDFVNQRMWHNAGRDEYVIFNTSVPHEAVPKHYQRDHNKGKYGKYVRATSKLTGYFIQPWRSPETGEVAGCSLTYITQTDPNGWIPTAVTNYISTKYAPNTIKNMRKAVLRFRTWLPAQMASGSYVKDWESEPKWWKEEGEVPSHTRDFAVRHWAGKKSAH